MITGDTMGTITIDYGFYEEILIIGFGSICANLYFISKKLWKSFFSGEGEKVRHG